jgi:heme-degrading monooxygenase HmoA
MKSGKPRKTGRKEGKAMYARLTKLDFKPDRIEEGIELFRNSVVPAAKSQKGLVAIYLLTDIPKGKAAALTFWRTEQDCVANERNLYYQEQLAKFLDFYQSMPIREGYEVTIKA